MTTTTTATTTTTTAVTTVKAVRGVPRSTPSSTTPAATAAAASRKGKFSVSYANKPTIRNAAMMGARHTSNTMKKFRPDLNRSDQIVFCETEKVTKQSAFLQQAQSAATCPAQDEIHHLRLLIMSAVQHQKQHHSISLSLHIMRSAENNLSKGVYNEEQLKEAKAILHGGAAFNMNYVLKNLLDDIELMYSRYGYRVALNAFCQLRPFQLVRRQSTRNNTTKTEKK